MSPLVAASDGDRQNPARGRPGLVGKGRLSGVGSPRVPFEAVRRSEDAPAMENGGVTDLRPPQPLFRCADRECSARCGSRVFREGQGRCVCVLERVEEARHSLGRVAAGGVAVKPRGALGTDDGAHMRLWFLPVDDRRREGGIGRGALTKERPYGLLQVRHARTACAGERRVAPCRHILLECAQRTGNQRNRGPTAGHGSPWRHLSQPYAGTGFGCHVDATTRAHAPVL
jgi:hypothetical protein